MSINFNLSCILFDLDGTLVDTAPDLIASLNKSLKLHGFTEVAPHSVRPYISYGAEVMIDNSIGQTDLNTRSNILDHMLTFYQNNIAEHSCFFTGMTETLNTIESLGLKWGIVTNKRERFTHPLVSALNLDTRAACIISGDTTAHTKPHPEPLFTACAQAKVKPEECVYIGDALHDIDAGKNANMKTLAATYGYLKPDDQPDQWGADLLIESPDHLTAWILETCH